MPRARPSRRFRLVRGRTRDPGDALDSGSMWSTALVGAPAAVALSPVSIRATSSARALTQASARVWALAGLEARASTPISTVPVGWLIEMSPTRAPGVVSRWSWSITRWATRELVATATYDDTRPLARLSLIVALEALAAGPALT